MKNIAFLLVMFGTALADFPPYLVNDFNCTTDPVTLCSRHGICNDLGTSCVCSEGYFTIPSALKNQCNDFDSSGVLNYQTVAPSSPSLRNSDGNGEQTPFKCEFPPEDCSNHGVCNRNGTGCICNDGYATYDPPVGQQCNYERKKQSIAFLAAWFTLGTGAVYFYIGETTLGLLNLFIGVGGIIALAILMCVGMCFCAHCGCRKINQENLMAFGGGIGYSLMILMFLVSFIWESVLLFQVGLNKLNDSNGIALKSW